MPDERQEIPKVLPRDRAAAVVGRVVAGHVRGGRERRGEGVFLCERRVLLGSEVPVPARALRVLFLPREDVAGPSNGPLAK